MASITINKYNGPAIRTKLTLLHPERIHLENNGPYTDAISFTIWKGASFIIVDKTEDNKIYRYDKVRIGKTDDLEEYKPYIEKKYHNLPFYKVLEDGVSAREDNMIIEPILDGEEAIVKQLRIYEVCDPALDDKLDIVKLFNDVKRFIEKHIDLDKNDAYKVTAWVFHAYLYDQFPSTVYLHIIGPKGSGKSKLAEVLSLLIPRPIKSSSMSTAAIAHYVENYNAILILDEQDKIDNGSKDSVKNDYLSILNAGYRRGECYTRMGDDNNPRSYNVFGPKIIVGRFSLPDTLESRCLMIKMVRSDRPMPYLIDEKEAEKLRRRLRTFVCKYYDKVKIRDLNLQEGRVRDLFIPLLCSIPKEVIPKFKDIIKDELSERSEEEQSSNDAIIVRVLTSYKEGEEVSAKDVYIKVEAIAEEIAKNEDISIGSLTAKKLGRKLTRWGFKKTRRNDGTYYTLDSKTIAKLKATYGMYKVGKVDLHGFGI